MNNSGPNTDSVRPVVLDGRWETRHRGVASAAFLGLFGIGILYFYGQAFLSILAVLPRGILADIPSDVLDDPILFLERLKTEILVSLVISQYGLMLAPTVWFVRRFHTVDVNKYLRINLNLLPLSIVAVAATLFIIPLGNYVAGKLTERLNLPDEILEAGLSLFAADSFPEYLFLLFVIAITPAICEEVFFRGFFQRSLERVIGWKSILVAGILFGLFHLQPIGLAATATMGLLFGYFFYRTRSLAPAVLAHFANNALVVSLLYFEPQIGGIDLANSTTIPFRWVLITIPVGVALLGLFHFLSSRTPDELIIPVGETTISDIAIDQQVDSGTIAPSDEGPQTPSD